jgi:hypothetical protein
MSIQPNYSKYPSNGTNPYPSDLAAGGAGDAYSQYEYQQLLPYIQNVKMLLSQTQQGTKNYQILQQDLSTAMSYLQMVDPQMASDPTMGSGAWDPLGGVLGADSQGGGMGVDPTGQGPAFPIDYQDSTHIVTSDGPSSSYTLDSKDSETRTIDFYQKDNTLIVPSNAADVTAAAQADDGVPGKTMVVVTFTCNGQTRTVKYHNADRDNFKLNIQTADKSQAVLDASLGALSSKVSVSELGEASDEAQGTRRI